MKFGQPPDATSAAQAIPKLRARPTRPPGEIIADEVESLYRDGFGALSIPEIERQIARIVLFKRMRSLCKPDLTHLRETCLPRYTALFEFGRKQVSRYADFPQVKITPSDEAGRAKSETVVLVDSWKALLVAAAYVPLAEDLKNGIFSWSKQRNIAVKWFMDALLRNLTGWHLQPPGAKQLHFFLPAGLSYSDTKRFSGTAGYSRYLKDLAASGPGFQSPIYNPAIQTREEHQNEVVESLKAYHAAQEERFLAEGFTETRAKRGRRGDPWEGLNWFIRYQICGQLAREIASAAGKESIDETAVNRAVRELCIVLGIPVRPRTSKVPTGLKRKRP
jgi:hypothetical protein